VLRQAYGPGSQPNEFLETHYWFGSRVTASYDENVGTYDAKVWISSNELKRQEQADEKAKAKKGANDL